MFVDGGRSKPNAVHSTAAVIINAFNYNENKLTELKEKAVFVKSRNYLTLVRRA